MPAGFLLIRNVFGFLSLYRKKPVLLRTGLPTWQRAIFTGARPAIVAAEVLNFCVRDEYRCVHFAFITRSLEVFPSKLNNSPNISCD